MQLGKTDFDMDYKLVILIYKLLQECRANHNQPFRIMWNIYLPG